MSAAHTKLALKRRELDSFDLKVLMGRIRQRLSNRKDEGTKKALKLFLGLVLGGCFAVHIWNWVAKCLDRDTIMVLRTNQDPDMKLPSLAICPGSASGFVQASMTELGLPADQWSGHEESSGESLHWRAPASREEIDRWHNQTTVSLESVVKEVTFYSHLDGETMILHPGATQTFNSSFIVTELPSLAYGKCFLVSVDVLISTPADFLQIDLNFPHEIGNFVVLAFEKGMEIPGIAVDFWPAPVYQNTIAKNVKSHLGLTKRSLYLDYKNSFCLPNVTRAESVQCLIQRTKSSIRNSCPTPCYWPGLSSWTKPEDPVCQTASDLRCMVKAVSNISLSLVGDRQCLPNCRVDMLTNHWRAMPMVRKANQSSLRVHYLDTEVEFSSESVLYDLVTMLSSVGGSMGLFLGFSFFDCGLVVIEYTWELMGWS